MVAPRAAGNEGLIPLRAGCQVAGVKFVKATAGKVEFTARLINLEITEAKLRKDVPQMGKTTPMLELGFSSHERSGNGGRCPPNPLGFFALGMLWQDEAGEP
jgi:hypothetical protein